MQRIVKIDNKDYYLIQLCSEVFTISVNKDEIHKLRIRFGNYHCFLQEFIVRGEGVEVSIFGENEPTLKIQYRVGVENGNFEPVKLLSNEIFTITATEPPYTVSLKNSRIINMEDEPLIIQGKYAGLDEIGPKQAFVHVTFALLRPIEASS